MKAILVINYILLLAIIISDTGCKKRDIENPITSLPARLKMADANADITLELPGNSVMLNGRIRGYTQNIQITRVNWEKISGPATYNLENPHSLQTKVSNLEKGTYLFELSVWDNANNFDIDTMTLTIDDASGANRQVFLWKMKMTIDPGPLYSYAYLEINNIQEFIPTSNTFTVSTNNTFTVYIKREGASSWELVAPRPNNPFFTGYVYYFRIKDGNPAMVISEDPDGFTSGGSTDIKIVY